MPSRSLRVKDLHVGGRPLCHTPACWDHRRKVVCSGEGQNWTSDVNYRTSRIPYPCKMPPPSKMLPWPLLGSLQGIVVLRFHPHMDRTFQGAWIPRTEAVCDASGRFESFRKEWRGQVMGMIEWTGATRRCYQTSQALRRKINPARR